MSGRSPRSSRRALPITRLESLEGRDLLTLIVGPVMAAEGVPFQGQVATFAASDVPGTAASEAKVTINWGDGTSTSNATIQAQGPDRFEVTSVHTYASDGLYPVSVVLTGNGGDPLIQSGLATVSDATLTATGVPFSVDAGRPFQFVVATAVSSNPTNPASDFTASIDWGDGTPSAPGTLALKPGGGFTVTGEHTYAQPGSAVARVTVVRTANGQSATTTTQATINALPQSLTGTGTTIAPIAGVPFDGVVVASFHAIPPIPGGQFVATINWGDGESSSGTIVPIGNGTYNVLGSHVYAAIPTAPPGSPPQSVTTQVTVTGAFSTQDGNLKTTMTGQALIQTPPFTGRLDPLSDTGASNQDGVTRLNQLKFTGTAQPFSLIQLYSNRTDQLGPVLLGQGAAGADGSWAIFAGPLADGRYALSATVTPPNGSPLLSFPLSPVTIDTVAPQVTAVSPLSTTGMLTIGFRDDRSGMDLGSLQTPRYYNLIGPRPHRPGSIQHPAQVAAQPLATNPSAAIVNLRAAMPVARLRTLQIIAGGVADMAGNPLRGGNFVTSLTTKRPVARIHLTPSSHHTRPGPTRRAEG